MITPAFVTVFIVGGLVAATLIGLLYRRRTAELEERLRERCQLVKREAELERDNWMGRKELELDKRRNELESEFRDRERELHSREEEAVSTLLVAEKERDGLERKRSELEERVKRVETAEDRLQELTTQYRQKLQEAGKLSFETAREELMAMVERECEDDVRSLRCERLSRSEKEIEMEARRLLMACMQRLSSVPHEDVTATLVHIPHEEMKGRIIGREGRNIKSFESMTGTTLLIDETPNSVLISSFDPVRREVARIALEALIQDGRIHPSSIEDAVRRGEEEVKQSVLQSGEDALRRLRLSRMHPEIVAALGKMRFRLANNQNVLEHSIEVAQLCSLMAAELGLDTDLAKRSGLLHDIGKVLDEEHEGSHAMAGAYFLKRLGSESPMVINAVAAHHEEIPAESPYVALVMTADSLSAVRPGVRADSMDGYLQRVKNLEAIALSMKGVVDAYAIQAGREIRVTVSPEKITDQSAILLARDLRRRIEDELQYPGNIRITVIREQRFTELAR